MPHYDQNGDGVNSSWHLNSTTKTTNLCTPTSISMMTQTMLNNNNTINWNSNIDIVHDHPRIFTSIRTYKNTPVNNKIQLMADTLDTTKTDGTGSGPASTFITNASNFFNPIIVIFNGRQSFFSGGRYNYNSDMGVSVNTMMNNNLNLGNEAAGYVNYGHYSRVKTPSSYFGYRFYKITRTGGHGVAQAGYLGNRLYIYDPWFKVKYFTALENIFPGTSSVRDISGDLNYYNLPNGHSHVSVIKEKYRVNDYWPIIEINGSFGKRSF